MDLNKFFYALYRLDRGGQPLAFLGNAFPVEPNGGLVTCRHVVDVVLGDGERLGIFDNELGRHVSISDVRMAEDPDLDIAFLPNALGRAKEEFFPLLDHRRILIGLEVYSFGWFAIGGLGVGNVERGYFGGRLVTIDANPPGRAIVTLPYAVLEGMSGSPILTYCNGPKVVGVAKGNRQSYVQASESIDLQDGEVRMRETTKRIVEFGLGYHSVVLLGELAQLGASQLVVTDEVVPIHGLE